MMLMTGTDFLDASFFTIAIAFGLMSVEIAGGYKSAAGLLNFVLILKFLLIAVVLKTVTLQATDSNLRAPRTTAEVMAVGFFALYVGSFVYRHLKKIRGVVKDVTDPKVYFWLAILFSIACLGSTFVILIFQTSYELALQGGLWGVAHQFELSSGFCVVPAMYYAWSSGSKRFLSHPLVLTILVVEILLGLATTTKEALMEPVLCYLSVGFIRYGIRSKAVWGIVATGAVFYVTIGYPYSQYVRSHGGRNGTLAERWQVIEEVFLNVATDSSFRQSVDSQIYSGNSYLGKESLEPIGRLAMVGEADRLVDATDQTQSYTGWETIIAGLQVAVPSFIMPMKPDFAVGNLLGHIGDQLANDDYATQISYGFMANLYNAFGLYGVLFGTIIFISSFYYMLRIWFANPDLNFSPWGSSIWYILIGMLFEHSLIEGPVANDLPAYINLGATVGLIWLAGFMAKVFRARRAPTIIRPYYPHY